MRFRTIIYISIAIEVSGTGCGFQGCAPGAIGIPALTPGDKPLLNEIQFYPAADQSAFVEIKTGRNSIDLSTLSLINQSGDRFALPAGLGQPLPGELVLIRFDGQGGAEGLLVHASPANFLPMQKGSVSLVDANGNVIDDVSWGGGGMDEVRVSRGGAALRLEAGTSIGRIPPSVTPSNGLEWVVYDSTQVTPGQPNPTPGATILIPLDGMEMPPGDILLSWYPVPGAAQYRIQVSIDSNFATTVLDTTVAQPPIHSGALTAGEYFWRVETFAADGSSSGVSPANTLVLDDGATATAKAKGDGQAIPGQILNVPLIEQRKDTNMLLLESARKDAGHEWDQPHPALDENDPADNMNCGLATIAMINAYKGGHLSQDRIGFQSLPGLEGISGPERDLMFGRGLYSPELQALLDWALGTTSVMTPHTSTADFFTDVQTSIARDMPLVLFRPGHFVVISGWRTVGGRQKVFINDPWHAHKGFIDINRYRFWEYWVLGATVNPQSDETTLSQDKDGDGINDFDETMRFGTNPNLADSDLDCIDDKTEIKNSMFDPVHGWANFASGLGGDGRARRHAVGLNGTVPVSGRPELDTDSDGGGLADSYEDFNGNGVYEPSLGESDPTDPSDDHRHITGTIDDVIYLENDFSDPSYSNTMEVSDERHHAVIDLQTDPASGKLKGTGQVTYTNHAYLVYRHPFTCSGGTATQLNIDHPDRQWTVNLTGNFYCRTTGGKRIIFIGASGTPDHSDVPDSITYHDPCYSDTQPGHTTGAWGGLSEDMDHANSVDVRIDHPLPGGISSGQYYHEVHLKIDR